MTNQSFGGLRLSWLFSPVLILSLIGCTRPQSVEKTTFSSAVSNLTALVALPANSLKQLDIARMNLLCAEGLTGTECLDIKDQGFTDCY